MSRSARQILLRAERIELVRSLRLWLGVVGVFALGLAGLAASNNIVNPKSWASAFSALAAAGALLPYAGWAASAAFVLFLLCGLLSLFLKWADREI